MKVLNLQCTHQHSFEGWFASEDDFQNQLSRGMIECPMCADKSVQKLPSAPRLNLGGHPSGQDLADQGKQASSSRAVALSSAQGSHDVAAVTGAPSGRSPAEQAAFLKALRHVMAHTEDVGGRFAEEARRMHYGEQEARSIRGQTSAREAVELIEEGIDVMPLPLPAAVKDTLQ
ncbi:DUF1178 family protein [Polaromonas aquatica]|uniref:DUF1178 family protein n=1 Tax=Polaromonas aquatica TaxID=332657 RepID=UPI003D64BE5B